MTKQHNTGAQHSTAHNTTVQLSASASHSTVRRSTIVLQKLLHSNHVRALLHVGALSTTAELNLTCDNVCNTTPMYRVANQQPHLFAPLSSLSCPSALFTRHTQLLYRARLAPRNSIFRSHRLLLRQSSKSYSGLSFTTAIAKDAHIMGTHSPRPSFSKRHMCVPLHTCFSMPLPPIESPIEPHCPCTTQLDPENPKNSENTFSTASRRRLIKRETQAHSASFFD